MFRNHNLFFQHNDKNGYLYGTNKIIFRYDATEFNFGYITNNTEFTFCNYKNYDKPYKFNETLHIYENIFNQIISVKYEIIVNTTNSDNSNYEKKFMKTMNQIGLELILDEKYNFLNELPVHTQQQIKDIEHIVNKNKNNIEIRNNKI